MKNNMVTYRCASLVVLLLLLPAKGIKEKVLLRSVESITLVSGQLTNARRSSRIQQAGRPKTVQCYNRGFDGQDVQWECKADLETNLKFGRLQVSCEGYDNADDPYILSNSCGLEYELDYVESPTPHKYTSFSSPNDQQTDRSYLRSLISSYQKPSGLFLLFCIAGAIAGIYFCCISSDNDSSQPPPPPPGFIPPGGGGPPPPGPGKRPYPSTAPPDYDSVYRDSDSSTHRRTQPSAPPPTYGWAPGSTHFGGGGGGGSYTHTVQPDAASAGTGGGSGWGSFFGGAALGALGSYLLRPRQRYQDRYSEPGGLFAEPNAAYGSHWAGASTARRTSPSASPSSTTRTASGFGGTTRR